MARFGRNRSTMLLFIKQVVVFCLKEDEALAKII
jgi:hypothetical protein